MQQLSKVQVIAGVIIVLTVLAFGLTFPIVTGHITVVLILAGPALLVLILACCASEKWKNTALVVSVGILLGCYLTPWTMVNRNWLLGFYDHFPFSLLWGFYTLLGALLMAVVDFTLQWLDSLAKRDKA